MPLRIVGDVGAADVPVKTADYFKETRRFIYFSELHDSTAEVV
jgi:hypothetical protein